MNPETPPPPTYTHTNYTVTHTSVNVSIVDYVKSPTVVVVVPSVYDIGVLWIPNLSSPLIAGSPIAGTMAMMNEIDMTTVGVPPTMIKKEKNHT